MAIEQGNGFALNRMNIDVLSSLELINEDNAMDFYKTFPDLRGGILAQLEAEGKIKMTGQETFRMYIQNNKPFNKFKVTDAEIEVVDSGEVTLTVADYTDEGETLSAPAVGLFFVESTTGIEFEVRAVDKSTAGAHEVTLAPTKLGIDVTIDGADAEFISVGRPSVQEASFQQEGEYDSWKERLNKISLVRTNKGYTDLASMEKVKFFDRDYMSLDSDTINKQHIDKKEWQFMHGDLRNNVQSAGNRNNTALGFLEIVKLWGTTLDGGGAGATLYFDFFQDIARTIDGNGFSNSYSALADTEAMFAIQQFLKDESLPVQAVVNGGDDLKAIFDYSDTFKIAGLNLRFRKYDYWNVNRIAGANAQNSAFSGQMLFMPEGAKVDGSGEYRSALRVRYMDNSLPTDNNRGVLNKLDYDGALFGQGTTREGQIALTSYIGADVLDAESFVHVKLSV